jgi:hypothetical protein
VNIYVYIYIFYHGTTARSGLGPPLCWGFTITLRHTTLGRTPPDERSALRKYLSMTTHNTHNRQISMPPAGFEPAIPTNERLHTHAFDRAATATENNVYTNSNCTNGLLRFVRKRGRAPSLSFYHDILWGCRRFPSGSCYLVLQNKVKIF